MRALRDYHAEGLVFAGSGRAGGGAANAELATHVEAARARGARVVALARREFPALRVGVDNAAAAYDVTDYLISLGHRRIAFVEGPPELYTSEERRAGFERRDGRGGPAATTCASRAASTSSRGSRRAASCSPAGRCPDAVVAANDEAAIGVLTRFRHAEVDVPGQVSVAGIDDTRPARFVELTTVNLPLYDLGAVAARHILAGADEAAGGRRRPRAPARAAAVDGAAARDAEAGAVARPRPHRAANRIESRGSRVRAAP